MGHIRVGRLPRYPRWKAVIGLLEDAEIPVSEVTDVADRETLTRTVGVDSATLFGARLTDVQIALKKYSTSKQFRTYPKIANMSKM